MKSWKKFLIVSLSFLFVVTSVFAGLSNFGNKNNNSNQNQQGSVVTPGKPDNTYGGMIYYASEGEDSGASQVEKKWKGGAIYIDDGSDFVMDGGTLCNHEGLYGGAVYVANGGTFTMKGGTIEYNYSKYGGAVYVEEGGTFIIEDGDIINNAAENAPAIYVEAGGHLKMSASAYVDANEYMEVHDTLINYYVDGEHVYSKNQLMPTLNLAKVPLSYDDCNGYYLDEEMTEDVNQGDDLSLLADNNLQTATSSDSLVFNLYTRKATLNNLNFADYWNDDTYHVTANTNDEKVVLPKTHNGKLVAGVQEITGPNIKEVVLNSNNLFLQIYCFRDMPKLEKVVIVGGIKSIDASLFNNVPLKELVIGSDVSSIIEVPFTEVAGTLSKITISEKNTVFDSRDNSNAIIETASNKLVLGLKNSTIPASVETIGKYAFMGMGLTSFVSGENVKTIENDAFSGCTLTNIQLNEGLESIDGTITVNTENLVLPDSLRHIDVGAFSGTATNFTIGRNIEFEDAGILFDGLVVENLTINNPVVPILDEVLFNYNDVSEIKTITLTDNVKSIDETALDGLTGVEELIVPDSVTTIGSMAFENMTSLKTLIIGDGVTTFDFGSVFNSTNIETLVLGNGITSVTGYKALSTPLENLKTLKIYGSINNQDILTSGAIPAVKNCNFGSNIPANFFRNNTTIEEVVIENGCNTIGDLAFYGCTALKGITFEDDCTLTTIGSGAFQNCTALTSLDLTNTQLVSLNCILGSSAGTALSAVTQITLPKSLVTINERAFMKNKTITDVIIPIDSNLQTISTYAFYNTDNLKNLNFNNATKLKTINYAAFAGCLSMTEFDISNTVVANINEQSICRGSTALKTIKFPETLVSIPSDMFGYCSGLEEVIIPEGIESIQSNVFQYCTSLTNVTLPNTLISLANNTFQGCDNLTELDVSNTKLSTVYLVGFNLTKIKVPATTTNISLYNQTSLVEADLSLMNCSDGVFTVNNSAFKGCSSLSRVIYPSNATQFHAGNYSFEGTLISNVDMFTNIGTGAFKNCLNLTNVNLNNCNSIGDSAFSGCTNLVNVDLSSMNCDGGTFNVANELFRGCSSLSSVVYPASATSINAGNYSFAGTAISSIDTFKSFGTGAFSNCLNLTDIYIVNLGDIPVSAFANCTGLKTVCINPGGDIIVRGNAFSNCTNLEEVQIGSSEYLTTIYANAFSSCVNLKSPILYGKANSTIAQDTFSGCQFTTLDLSNFKITGSASSFTDSNIENIILPTTITYFYFRNDVNLKTVEIKGDGYIETISAHAFVNCQNLQSFVSNVPITTIGTAAFQSCPNLVSFSSPEVQIIEHAAFRYSDKLQTVNVGDNICNDIASEAFSGCSSLLSFRMCNYARSIGASAFAGCESMTEFYVGGTALTTIPASAFSGCYSLESFTFEERGSVTIASSAFINCSALKSFDFTNITDVGVSAFKGTGLEEVHIPSTVKHIRQYAFQNCTSLTSLTFEEGFERIWNYAFNGCINLGGNIIFPASLTRLGYASFQGCSSITGVSFADTTTNLTDIDNYVFAQCSSISSITLPEGLENIRHFAFEDTTFTSISMPSTLKLLGASAFRGNTNLTSLTFRDTSDWLFIKHVDFTNDGLPQIFDDNITINSQTTINNLRNEIYYDEAINNNTFYYYTKLNPDYITYSVELGKYVYYDSVLGIMYHFNEEGYAEPVVS